LKIIITSAFGGHTTTAIAIGRVLKNEKLGFLVSRDAKESIERLKNENIGKIFPVTLPRYPDTSSKEASLRFFICMREVYKIFREFKPDIVIGTGASIQVPAIIIAKVFRCKTVICEANDRKTPSLATRLSKPFSDVVLLPRKELKEHIKDGIYVGAILPDLGTKDKKSVLDELNLDVNKKTLVFACGTLGAPDILKVFFNLINKDKLSNFNIIISSGKSEVNGKGTYRKNVVMREFFLNFSDILSISDIVITRGGLTSYEVAMFGKPQIIIPDLNAMADHQSITARELEKRGNAIVLDERELSEDKLLNAIERCWSLNPKKLIFEKNRFKRIIYDIVKVNH